MKGAGIAVAFTGVLAALVVASYLVEGLVGSAMGGFAGSLAGWATLFAPFVVPWASMIWGEPYRIAGTTVINAPPARVWDEVMFRARDDHYQPTFPRIEAVDADAGRWRMCVRAGLRDEGASMPDLEIETVEVDPDHYLSYRVLNAADLPLWSKHLALTEYRLAEVAEGQTRLTLIETLSKLGNLTFIALLFLNPCRDAVEGLKARIETGTNDSWMARQVAADASGGQSPFARNMMFGLIVLSIVVAGISLWLVTSVLAHAG